MNKRDEVNKIVKESITGALFKLMKTKEYKTITITELTNKAGVSRISFYRNFDSKEDIIIKELEKNIKIWKEQFDNDKNQDIVYQIFILFNNHKELIDTLYKANLQHILAEQFLYGFDYKETDENVIAYSKSMIAYGMFGICNEWYKRGMQESAEEISKIVKETQKNENK